MLCKIFGHKWIPVYISGRYGNYTVKFIGTHCKRCNHGHDDLIKTIDVQDEVIFNTYNSSYYESA